MPEAPREIVELVENFKRNLKAYKNPNYKEEQLKQEFLNPFFKALGWDVDNEQGAAPQYRDVIFEDSIKVGGGTKAPDYCFTLAGARKFFVEAKKPSVDIKIGIQPSYQLRRYAWSAKLPVSILSDFEEFSVYEARSRPKKNESAAMGRILYYTFEDYVDKWNEIYNIFSKEAVLKGKFDIFAEGTKKKRGTQEVDDEFLSEIESWRDLLAKNIALRNEKLSVEGLNYAVQQIIDRIVFLRMCEDRGIEPQDQLKSLLEDENIYEGFCKLCTNADEKYNSGLFHFKEEKGRNTPHDDLTMGLKIDDGVFKTIIKNIYYPSPYEFSVIPVEILGHVYEQFLGKVIRLTAGHRAKVEEKPEVKKAGGVYYTPQFIVDYIVENTVGKLCEGKTPNKVSELKILDPACGSGSFLLGAYTYLLKWHLDYYTNLSDKKRLKDKIYQGKGGEWFLTIKEKKQILLNNIYGVDIDPQAVEVTKLSLLLKVLEGENKDVIEAQQKLFRERALPDLESNIKCGNSLIGSDFYDSDLTLSGEEVVKINAFDWEDEFDKIMENSGFDAVIGNPPYLRIQTMKEWAPIEVEHYKKQYIAASKGNYDIYVVFVERGLHLINENGLLGFILPHKFFNAKYGEPLRSLIAKGKNLDKIVHFGDQQIFARATTYTNLLFLNKSGHNKFKFVKVDDLDKWKISKDANKGKIDLKKVTGEEWNFIVGEGAKIIDKLGKIPFKLKDVVNGMFVGQQTSADTVYLFKEFNNDNDNIKKVFSKELNKWVKIESRILKPVIRSGDIHRYHARPTAFVLFPYIVKNCSATLISPEIMKDKYPLAWKYLNENKKLLESREKGKFKDAEWYRFGRTQNLGMWEQEKLMVPYMITELAAYLDQSDNYYFINVTTGGYGVTCNEKMINLKYLCGLLNSPLLDFYLKHISTTFRGGYFAANKQYIEKLPIRTIDFQNPDDVAQHDKMVKLVEQMLQLHQNLDAAKTPNEKKMLERQIDATDKQIDKLVYELYDLTEDEIKIVEESINK